MEFVPKNRILKFRPDQVQYVRKLYNFDRLGDMTRAIDNLEIWIKMQRHFTKKNFSRNYLEKLIIENKGSLERAKLKLDKICTFRTIMPDFFGKNLTNDTFLALNNLLDEFCFNSRSAVLPQTTEDFFRVYILKAVGSAFPHNQFMMLYKFIVLICEYVMAYDYSHGYILIIDYTEAEMYELIKSINIIELRHIFTIITEGFGLRLKGIHVVTSSKAVDTLVSILKQLISPKLGKRICIHKDISTVYKYVPKDIFPMEYGGNEKSYNELSDELVEELTGKEYMTYIDEMNNAKTDESCRQTDLVNNHYLGVPGSFRNLNVD